MKVLLVVIDAATPHVVCPAIRTGQLPVLHQLAEAGTMHEASVSIFPSITPAATTSIVTGTYPAEHGIAGASWFDAHRNEVAYYGDDFWVIAREGFGHFVNDFLLRLNGDRLRAPTLFQMVEHTGRTAACLNYLVFRGDWPHRVRIPGIMAALPGVPLTETVEGPSKLSLGDFVGTSVAGRTLHEKGGLLHRFGMDDASTGSLLEDLCGAGPLPDLTVAYFADNDYRSHEVGPHDALPVIQQVDRMLGRAIDAAGGLDRLLADTLVVVTSDHGHCEVMNDAAAAVIRLDALLANHRQARLGGAWGERDEIMICPNMRAAQIYVRNPTAEKIERLSRDLLADRRVDQVIWRSSLTRTGAEGYTVASPRGRLEFSRAHSHSSHGSHSSDASGGRWLWQGDGEVLDLLVEDSTVDFGQYPNAFERIAGVLDLDQSGEIWVTARPGCEFEVPGGKAHVGGASHGALHALDSFSPFVAAGPVRLVLPRQFRSIDIAPVCMEALGIPMRYRPGEPRILDTETSVRG
jgi:hypothetical protein